MSKKKEKVFDQILTDSFGRKIITFVRFFVLCGIATYLKRCDRMF